MLKTGAHQYAFITTDNVYRAVTLMHIEIDNGHPLQVMKGECPHRGQGDIVIETKPHRLGSFGMVSRWAGTDKGVGYLAAHNHIDSLHIAACGQPGGSQGIRHHRGVRVGEHPAPGRLHQVQLVQIAFRMHGQQLVPGNFFRTNPVQFLLQVGICEVGENA